MNGNLSTHGARLIVAATAVFGPAAGPAVLTDLDLSSFVGARSCLVILSILNGSAGGVDVIVRRNGDTGDYARYGASCILGLTAGDSGIFVCTTDSAGIIEWQANGNPFTIRLEAYAYG